MLLCFIACTGLGTGYYAWNLISNNIIILQHTLLTDFKLPVYMYCHCAWCCLLIKHLFGSA